MTTGRNLLRRDPQRLGLLRRQFLGELRKALALVKSRVWAAIVTDDLLGLRESVGFGAGDPLRYLPIDQRVAKFVDWLAGELSSVLLQQDGFGKQQFAKYAQQAYVKGGQRTFADIHRLRRALHPEQYSIRERQFIHQLTNSPAGRAKISAISQRTESHIAGMVTSIMQDVPHIVVLGITRKVSPRVLARAISNQISGTKGRQVIIANARKNTGSEARAARIVATESAGAFAEGQLDALAALGLEDVEVLAEWVTADDPCPECEELEGTVWSLEEAYGMIPRHPNCKCAFAAVDAEGLEDITSDWFT